MSNNLYGFWRIFRTKICLSVIVMNVNPIRASSLLSSFTILRSSIKRLNGISTVSFSLVRSQEINSESPIITFSATISRLSNAVWPVLFPQEIRNIERKAMPENRDKNSHFISITFIYD